jgi:hypothetical protein
MTKCRRQAVSCGGCRSTAQLDGLTLDHQTGHLTYLHPHSHSAVLPVRYAMKARQLGYGSQRLLLDIHGDHAQRNLNGNAQLLRTLQTVYRRTVYQFSVLSFVVAALLAACRNLPSADVACLSAASIKQCMPAGKTVTLRGLRSCTV